MSKTLLFVVLLVLCYAFVLVQAQEGTTPEATSAADGTVNNDIRPDVRGSKTDDTNDEALKKVNEALGKGNKFQFQAEINQLLAIIINSLYTNKEIFLRELISNASDALDKIRFISVTNKTALDSGADLGIKIRSYPETNTLVIRDSGIGMTREDLERNLGTIARSGTKAFLEKLKQSKESLSLIGQFGVGFYSAFLVADSVVVVSKHNDDKQHIWESKADNTFVIAEDPRGDTLGRGTEIILHLKDDAKDYLKDETLKDLITRYSEFIQYPISLYTTKNVTREVEEEKPAETTESTTEEKKDEVKVEEEKKEEEKKTKKTITETEQKWEVLNENKPIWTRNPKEITKEEYIKFYKAISKAVDDPLTWIHFKSEGSSADFKSLLYIPENAPYNMFDFMSKNANIRLYVRRVFITDAINDLMPRYLNFIRGIVDSEDMPLNISRELLQNSKLLKLIKKKLVSKAISMMTQMAEAEEKAKKKEKESTEATEEQKKEATEASNKYSKFWKEYGKNVRLGVIEDTENRQRLVKLVRYYSTKSEFFLTGLDDYVSRMKSNQKHIYYIAGETLEEVKKSPFLEELRNRDLEVLYLTDPIDEYMTQAVKEYNGKELMSITREGLKFDETDDAKKKAEELKKEFEPLTNFYKDSMGQKIIRADVGSRFTNAQQSPCVVAATQHGYTANMMRILKSQTLGNNEQQMVNMFNNAKIIEINPYHPVIIELNKKVKTDKSDPSAKKIAELLFETASMRSGYAMEDPAGFADRVFDLMRVGLTQDEGFSATTKSATSDKDEL